MEHFTSRAPIALHVDDMEAGRVRLTDAGVEFQDETFDTARAEVAPRRRHPSHVVVATNARRLTATARRPTATAPPRAVLCVCARFRGETSGWVGVGGARQHRRPGPGWTPASSSCSPPLDRSSGPSTGLVAFRPAIGKSDQPWSTQGRDHAGRGRPESPVRLGVQGSGRSQRSGVPRSGRRGGHARSAAAGGHARRAAAGVSPRRVGLFRPRIGKNDSNRGRQPVRRRRSSEDSAFGQRRSGCGHRSPDRPTPDR